MSSLLQLAGIRRSFPGREVLVGVDLRVGQAEIVGLVGENGAGKSSLAGIVSGTAQPNSGSMSLFGVGYGPQTPEQARALGVDVVQQRIELDPTATVAASVFRGTLQEGRTQDELRRAARWALGDVGLDLDPDQLIGEVPRPLWGLVEAARMLAGDAHLVVMDEVSAPLTVKEIGNLHDLARRLTRQGRSVLYVSHRLSEVLAICDRVAVLRDGVIALDRPSAELTVDDLATAMVSTGDARARAATTAPRHLAPLPTELPATPQIGDRSDPMVRLRGLTVDSRVHDVDLDLWAGEIIGLTGHRDSGVHQIAGALVGQTAHTARELTVHGETRVIDSPEAAAALRIAYFSEDDEVLGIDSSESIARSMMTAGWDEGTDFDQEVASLRSIIATIQKLEVRAKSIRQRVGSLSGGDQHKLSLAKWIASDSDIMVLNAPTRGLDVWAQREMRQVLQEAMNRGAAAIVVSVDPDELRQWCSRVAVIENGTVARWLTPDLITTEWSSPAAG